MRYLLIAAVALFLSGQSHASPVACNEHINFCPTIALSVTDAVTGKSLFSTFGDSIWIVNQFEPLKFEIVTTFQPVATGIIGIPPATGIIGIFGDPPLPGAPAYSFQPGSPPFIETTDVSNQLTNNGENFFFSGHFTAAGFAKIDSTVIDNAGNDATLGSFANPGDIIDVLPNVPEPSTWVMLLIGFAGIGLIARRRRENLSVGG